MKSLIVAAVAIHALAAGAGDAAPIVKVGLYKNGLAVVTRKVAPDSTGTSADIKSMPFPSSPKASR